jgi:hypothetical protein
MDPSRTSRTSNDAIEAGYRQPGCAATFALLLTDSSAVWSRVPMHDDRVVDKQDYALSGSTLAVGIVTRSVSEGCRRLEISLAHALSLGVAISWFNPNLSCDGLLSSYEPGLRSRSHGSLAV